MERFIAEGYKQTEVGVVPEDWKVVRLADIDRCEIVDGDRGKNYPSSSELRSSGYCLFLNAGNVTTNGFQFNGCEFISKERDALLSKGKLHPNDIVLTTRGTIGNIAFFNNAVPYSNLRINSGMVLIRNNNTSIHINYLFMILKSSIVKRQILQASFGSAQPQLTVRGIGSFKIILPKEKIEQQAIATALSDVDNLISSLEQLIEKKNAIKQGTMQELLTGRRRLKGFGEGKRYKQTELGLIPEDWEVKTLENASNIIMGQSPSSKYYNTSGYGLPLIQGNADIENRKTIKRVFTSEVTKLVEKGSIIMSVRAPVGDISKAFFNACMGRGVCSFSYPNEYLYHYLIFVEKTWGQFSTGSTFDAINSSTVKGRKIMLPSSSKEQIAIAQVLSDMDSEIENLETKVDKYKQIKQGMMQNLLTGRIRLV